MSRRATTAQAVKTGLATFSITVLVLLANTTANGGAPFA